jgi:TIR domain-containing protein
MSELPSFKGFFSYAHHDALTDPQLVDAFTKTLENRVNARLVNARFSIWRDVEGLRTGNIWNERIETQLRASDILIILLTPRWVDSEFCRKEYLIFEEVEAKREIGEYVAPILARALDQQEKHFTSDQKDVYARLKSRQYQSVLAPDFLKLNEDARTLLIDKIADDVEAIVERRRELPDHHFSVSHPSRIKRSKAAKEFDSAAHNFGDVDFISNVEVNIERPRDERDRSIYAQVDFLGKLYVQGVHGRIEFGVQRAYLSIENNGPGVLSQTDEIRVNSHNNDVYYVTRHEAPQAICICIDPGSDKPVLAELALPPASNENYWSRVASATRDVKADQLSAELIVTLSTEGLYLVDYSGQEPSQSTQNRIKAIMSIAARKDQSVNETGRICRPIPVKERT